MISFANTRNILAQFSNKTCIQLVKIERSIIHCIGHPNWRQNKRCRIFSSASYRVFASPLTRILIFAIRFIDYLNEKYWIDGENEWQNCVARTGLNENSATGIGYSNEVERFVYRRALAQLKYSHSISVREQWCWIRRWIRCDWSSLEDPQYNTRMFLVFKIKT